MHDSATPEPETTINTGGGPAISGNVNIHNGDFISGDKIIAAPPERALYVNVPPLPTYLYGREAVIDGLVTQLIAGTSTALCAEGLPGVGKTTLAVALAHHKTILAHFTDGVLWAGLGPQANVAAIQAQWATALDVDLTDVADPHARRQRLDNAIGQRKLLLVIDDAWELDAAKLLRSVGPQVAHLLTTRDRALANAFAGASHAVSVSVLDGASGYALLQALAPKACAADPLAAQNLVGAVGGLPLAIELLGGYLAAPERSLFPDLSQQAFAELADPQQRLQLATERLGQPGQVTTLLATIALSLDDLARSKPAAVATFYALGAFAAKPATFTRAAAEAVTGCDGATLAVLIARNLVEQVATPEQSGTVSTDPATTQLALHQTLADVAQQQSSSGLFATHRDYYLTLVEENPEDWQRVKQLYPQVIRAWEQQIIFNAPSSVFIRFTKATGTYQRRQGLLSDRMSWLTHTLTIAEGEAALSTIALLCNNIGLVYLSLGDKQQALNFYERALLLFRQIGDRRNEAVALNNIGGVYDELGEKQRALDYYNQALPVRREMGDRSGEATTFNNIGGMYTDLEDGDQALIHFNQALLIFQQNNDRSGEATTLNNIGRLYARLGEKERALTFYKKALPIYQQVGDLGGAAITLNNIGRLYAKLGNQQAAITFYNHAISIYQQINDRRGERMVHYHLAIAYKELGGRTEIINELRIVVELGEAIGHPNVEMNRKELAQVEALLAT